ncbi:MAG: hypothetical protein OQK78_03070 [Gammaproteobacteria bacterium]|nr:hypothetical protein [Gammaproteobacteria bacterium]
MPHRLTAPLSSPHKLSQSVVQAGEMLGLVRAEVARILEFRCENISALYDGRLILEEGTSAYENAALFIRFYQALYDRMEGSEPKMIHWLRGRKRDLDNSPFYLMIDEGKLGLVVKYLESSGSESIY